MPPRRPARNGFPWKWSGGLRVVHPGVVPFAKKILSDPSDALTRLVLADFVQELGLPGCEGAAAELRRDGYWTVNRPQNSRFLALAWWPGSGSVGTGVCDVSRRVVPACCGRHRPKPRGHFRTSRNHAGWLCRACVGEMFVGAA